METKKIDNEVQNKMHMAVAEPLPISCHNIKLYLRFDILYLLGTVFIEKFEEVH